ncbi:MAG: transketolase C-terminal domain-containing protein [Chloroflexota bacterium]|nr:transketolase C-terminal domain-containing protein [Chloroflexota bacterium]
MVEKMFITGNEAVGVGAMNAGCDAFFGYPITPQNEIIAWFAKEMPKRGKVFVQTHAETGSINMLIGGGLTGARVITSTSSVGWDLMQEGMSNMVWAETPGVILLVQRGGPGEGHPRHSQQDYTSATRGASGGYKVPVLTPGSVQEQHDLVQLAFYMSDKYLTPVIILTEAVLGQMAEPIESKTLDFGPLPPKEWAMKGKGSRRKDYNEWAMMAPSGVKKDKNFVKKDTMRAMYYVNEWMPTVKLLENKYQQIKENEVRYDTYMADDAELLIVAFGYMARVCREVVDMARAEGLKVGLFRPITVWPFPEEQIREKADQGVKLMVAEDNMGQMIDDVKMAVEGRTPIYFAGMDLRHLPSGMGLIYPDRILEEVKKYV